MAVLTLPSYRLSLNGVALDVVDNALALSFDEGNSPWMTASATITRPTDAQMDLLRPEANSLLNLTVSSLSLTLRVITWQFSPDEDRVTLSLASNEYLLQTYSPRYVIDCNAANQGSVLGLAGRVLSQVWGYTVTPSLAPGASDTSFKTYTQVQNLMPNGSFEISSGQWTARNVAIQQDTNWRQFGSYSLRITPNTTSTSSYVQMSVPLTPGQTYTMSAYIRTAGSAQSGSLLDDARKIQYVATVGGSQYIVRSSQVPNTTNTTQRLSMTFTVPWNATESVLRVINGATNSADNRINVDGILLVEGNGLDTNGQPLDYFDGNNANTSEFAYTWDDTAGLSSSTRTPTLDRGPEALVWTPGQTADEFIRPVLESQGYRLFLNEQGQWLMADNSYKVAGSVGFRSGSSLYSGGETSSLEDDDADGFPMNADAVIIRYSWTDALGREKQKSDIAATVNYSRPYVLEKENTPYPGPGQARYLLTRLQARTRRIDATGRPDWSARPGMDAIVTLPNRPVASGYVQALTWDLSQNAMALTTKGLVTLVTGSVGKAPTTQTVGSVSGTVANYTN